MAKSIQTDTETDIKYMRVVELELGQPLPPLSARDEEAGLRYRGARCLVRLHSCPLGLVDLSFAEDEDELRPQDYAAELWQALATEIELHMHLDDLPVPESLDETGLPVASTPRCIAEREAFFATAPFISIVVSTHNRTSDLAQCLPALLAQHYPDYEVVIVDNAPSSDETRDYIQRICGEEPRLRYVCEPVAGLSRGLNCGIKNAKGSLIAFTDDDVVVDTYWLLNLARAFALRDDVVCVTGLVVPRELQTRAQILFEEYGGFCKGFTRRIYNLSDQRPAEPLFPYTAGRFGTGASMAFHAAFLREINGFDPALQCAMDIVNFFQAIKRGNSLVYEPGALAYHCHRRAYDALQRQIYSYGVGLTAYLTKVIIEQPRYLPELLLKIPYGLLFTLSKRSPKNQKKQVYYPEELTRLERQGMLKGPFVYLRERRRSPRKAFV